MAEKALIIVPTYNERENISRLVDAVLRQDGRLEVLVVDDGSPDGTGQIVAELEDVHRARIAVQLRGQCQSHAAPCP